MKRKTLINKLDAEFSRIVRQVGYCERCGNTKSLQCSHIFSRKHLATRWDFNNATCLCVACHLYWWHKSPVEAYQWIEGIKGKKFLNELRKKAYSTVKWTETEMTELLDEFKSRND